MDVPRIRIAIDPLLTERFGPEIHWTWRLLLSGIGFAWQEVAYGDEECDIAYGVPNGALPPCRLFIRGAPESWERRADFRLGRLANGDGLLHPAFEGEAGPARPVGQDDGRLVCDRDIVFDVFWLATGQEEKAWPRNRHGHLDQSGTAFYREGVARKAVGTGIAQWLETNFERLGFPAPVARWPDGKRAAACLGHDVDYPEVLRWLEPLRIVHKRGATGLSAALDVARGSRTHWHFASWMELERRFGARSAFYFVARKGPLFEYATGTPDSFYDIGAPHFRPVFDALAGEGFEIALHASYRAHESRTTFAEELERLGEASGQQIVGNRHHYWHMDPDDPEATLLMHEDIGLEHDASLSNERYVGWRRGLCWPFFPFHQRERRALGTLQISTSWMDDHLFGHRSDNPGERAELLRATAETAARQGGCLCIDVHDYVFDDALFPEFSKTYADLLEHLATRGDYWIDAPNRIAGHWIDRHRAIVEASRGLTAQVGR